MKLVINGTEKNVPEHLETIGALLNYLQLGERKSVIERNGRILNKEEYGKEPVQDGDVLEVVHFVGGG